MLTPHTRDLDCPELIELVARLAAAPEDWRDLVTHRPDARTYEQLHRDDHVAVWLICWMKRPRHRVPRPRPLRGRPGGRCRRGPGGASGGRRAARQPHALGGQSLSFGASDIHRVSHAGAEPAVTLHAYSPPLWRMGAYEVAEGGTLQRHSLSYAEELRPLAA